MHASRAALFPRPNRHRRVLPALRLEVARAGGADRLVQLSQRRPLRYWLGSFPRSKPRFGLQGSLDPEAQQQNIRFRDPRRALRYFSPIELERLARDFGADRLPRKRVLWWMPEEANCRTH